MSIVSATVDGSSHVAVVLITVAAILGAAGCALGVAVLWQQLGKRRRRRK